MVPLGCFSEVKKDFSLKPPDPCFPAEVILLIQEEKHFITVYHWSFTIGLIAPGFHHRLLSLQTLALGGGGPLPLPLAFGAAPEKRVYRLGPHLAVCLFVLKRKSNET